MFKYIYFSIVALIIGGVTFAMLRAEKPKEEKTPPPVQEVKASPEEKPIETPPVVATTTPEVRTEIIEYTVKPGDVFGTIAEEFHISVNTILWENNLSATGLIRPGDKLRILPFTGISYKVKSGDTISKIANASGAAEEEIKKANNLADNTALKIGQVLLIPGGKKIVVAPTPKPVVKPAPTKTTTPTTTTPATAVSSVTWTSGALAELAKIPSTLRPSVKTKITNYCKANGIKTITKEIYLSIRI